MPINWLAILLTNPAIIESIVKLLTVIIERVPLSEQEGGTNEEKHLRVVKETEKMAKEFGVNLRPENIDTLIRIAVESIKDNAIDKNR